MNRFASGLLVAVMASAVAACGNHPWDSKVGRTGLDVTVDLDNDQDKDGRDTDIDVGGGLHIVATKVACDDVRDDDQDQDWYDDQDQDDRDDDQDDRDDDQDQDDRDDDQDDRDDDQDQDDRDDDQDDRDDDQDQDDRDDDQDDRDDDQDQDDRDDDQDDRDDDQDQDDRDDDDQARDLDLGDTVSETIDLREAANGDASRVGHFLILPEGCYDIEVFFVDEDGTVSRDCEGGKARNVEIQDGETAEVLLVAQCEAEGRGAVDITTRVNHAPVIESLDFFPSKFGYECEELRLCATAYDKDHDPIAFEWRKVAGERLHQQPRVVDRDVNDDGSITECVEIVAADASDYVFRVTMYDLFSDGDKIDTWLQDNGYSARSYDSLDFPVVIETDTEFMCYDAGDQEFKRFPWQRDIDTVNGCQPTTVREDACEHNKNGSCKNGQYDPRKVFGVCD